MILIVKIVRHSSSIFGGCFHQPLFFVERRGGLLVSALYSGSSGPGSSPGGDIVLCSWARHLTLTVPLSTQVYKWVSANLMQGLTLRWTGIPSRGE